MLITCGIVFVKKDTIELQKLLTASTQLLNASGIVSVKNDTIEPHTLLHTSHMLCHIPITASLKTSFVFHKYIIPATKPAIAAAINTNGFIAITAFNIACDFAIALTANVPSCIADANPIIIVPTSNTASPAPIPSNADITSFELSTTHSKAPFSGSNIAPNPGNASANPSLIPFPIPAITFIPSSTSEGNNSTIPFANASTIFPALKEIESILSLIPSTNACITIIDAFIKSGAKLAIPSTICENTSPKQYTNPSKPPFKKASFNSLTIPFADWTISFSGLSMDWYNSIPKPSIADFKVVIWPLRLSFIFLAISSADPPALSKDSAYPSILSEPSFNKIPIALIESAVNTPDKAACLWDSVIPSVAFSTPFTTSTKSKKLPFASVTATLVSPILMAPSFILAPISLIIADTEVPAWLPLSISLDNAINTAFVWVISWPNPAALTPQFFIASANWSALVFAVACANANWSAILPASPASIPNALKISVIASDASASCIPEAAAMFKIPSKPSILCWVFHPARAIYCKASADSVALNCVDAPIAFALSSNAFNCSPDAPLKAPTFDIAASKSDPTFVANPPIPVNATPVAANVLVNPFTAEPALLNALIKDFSSLPAMLIAISYCELFAKHITNLLW